MFCLPPYTSRMHPRPRHLLLLLLPLALLAALPLTGLWRPSPSAHAGPPAATEPAVRVELRSWVVYGRGRHLYALIHWPDQDAPETVEYWSTARWRNYQPPPDEARRERIAKMPRGIIVRPAYAEQAATDRHEADWTLPLSRAKAIADERVFEERYYLLGPNSTSGLRAAFRAAGLDFPAHITLGAGIWGEFPGVDLSPGNEIDREQWASYGISQHYPVDPRDNTRLNSAPPTLPPAPAYLK